jgi:MFS family permease
MSQLVYRVTHSISTLGYVGFSLCVAFGRYFSDHFTVVIGRRQLLTYSGLLAAVGLGVVVAGPSMTSSLQQSAVVAIIGFSLCGVGLSAISPTVTSLAGSHEVSEAARLKPAETIGIVTSVGYLGVMLSPPLMGGLSIWLHSLRWSFAVDAGCLLFISLIALLIRKDALVVK